MDETNEQLISSVMSEVGKRGGKSLVKRYGREYMAEIAKRGGNKTKENRGSEFYKEINKKSHESKRRTKND